MGLIHWADLGCGALFACARARRICCRQVWMGLIHWVSLARELATPEKNGWVKKSPSFARIGRRKRLPYQLGFRGIGRAARRQKGDRLFQFSGLARALGKNPPSFRYCGEKLRLFGRFPRQSGVYSPENTALSVYLPDARKHLWGLPFSGLLRTVSTHLKYLHDCSWRIHGLHNGLVLKKSNHYVKHELGSAH
jgi:hypothetical protein